MSNRNRQGHGVRLCLTSLAVLLFAGCAGQNVEGRWKGPWPLPEATDCVTKLRASAVFEMICQSREPDVPEWAGVGIYTFDGEKLRFEFRTLARRGEGQDPGAPVVLDIRGHGNRLEIAGGGLDRPTEWIRSME